MATHLELAVLSSDDVLRTKIGVAITIAAGRLIDKSGKTVKEETWANAALRNTDAEARVLIKYVLGKEEDSSVEDIQALSKEVIQDHVNSAVAGLVIGGA
jgi:hypothetical protein